MENVALSFFALVRPVDLNGVVALVEAVALVGPAIFQPAIVRLLPVSW